MQSAIWHSWEFGGCYRRVPYGTLGRERVKVFSWLIVKWVLLTYHVYHLPGIIGGVCMCKS